MSPDALEAIICYEPAFITALLSTNYKIFFAIQFYQQVCRTVQSIVAWLKMPAFN